MTRIDILATRRPTTTTSTQKPSRRRTVARTAAWVISVTLVGASALALQVDVDLRLNLKTAVSATQA